MSAFEQRFPFPANGLIVIQSTGDLRVQGWEQKEVLVRTPEADAALAQAQSDRLSVLSRSDVEVFAPKQARIRIENTSGDAVIVDMAGYMEISRVSGDLAVQSCSKVDVGIVNGDAELLQVEGPAGLRRVGGDLLIECRNRVIAEQVGGDATIIADALVRVKSGGDLSIRLLSVEVEEVNARCGGDLSLFALPGLGAQVDVNSGGHSIVMRLPDQTLHLDQGHYSATLGSGKTLLRLSAGGDVQIELGEAVDREVDASRHSMGSKFVSTGVVDMTGFSPQIEEKIRQKMEFATRKAEERARRAEERVRRAMERVEQVQRHAGHRKFNWFGIRSGWEDKPAEPLAPQPPEAPEAPETSAFSDRSFSQVSNEERLLVLKMLQEHKITVEEAEQLLAALDGDLDVE